MSGPTSLSVRVAYSVAAKLLAQHRILCEQILGEALVGSRHPSGDGQEQEMQRQARHRPEPSAVSGGALGLNTTVFSAICGWHTTGLTYLEFVTQTGAKHVVCLTLLSGRDFRSAVIAQVRVLPLD
jgi:hypothetical protein